MRLRSWLSGLVDRAIASRDNTPLPVRPRPDRSVDSAARFLVQKLARLNAAHQAVLVLEAERRRGNFNYEACKSAERRLRIARDHVFVATTELRLALGLAEHPSAVEVNGWGEAP